MDRPSKPAVVGEVRPASATRPRSASPFSAPTEPDPDRFRPFKVLLADDHPLVIAALCRRLQEQDDVEVVGQAQGPAELLALVERHRPDIVLTDLRMPGVSGFELIEALRERFPQVKIVVLSSSDDRDSVDGALLAGASAFIAKTAALTDVASVLRQVHNGAVFHALSTLRATPGSSSAGDGATDDGPFTERERTILSAIASGKTTAVISKELWVSERTIKFHLTNICRKVGAPNRDAAVRYAIDHGLIAEAAASSATGGKPEPPGIFSRTLSGDGDGTAAPLP